MPLSFWTAIPASRFFPGALWTSNLSLDHIGRTFALFAAISNGRIPLTTLGAPGTVTRDVTIVFPPSWGPDQVFADMKLVLQIEVFVTITGVGANPVGSIGLVGGSNSKSLIFVQHFLTKDYLAPFPTGPTTETIEMVWTSGGATSVNFLRTHESDGPSCCWGIVPAE